MTDVELEDRVREALRAVADATPLDAAVRPPRRGPRRLVAAAVVAGGILAASLVVTAGRDGDVTTVADRPEGTAAAPSPLPAGFDVRTASPVFVDDGEAADVADAYLRDRFPDHPEPGVSLGAPVVDGPLVRVRWSTRSDTEGELGAGDIVLRQVDGAWGVVAATTDDVDLSGLGYDGERVAGAVTTAAGQPLFAEVRDWRGDFVHRAPDRFGGAVGELEIDVRHPLAPTTVRVLQVGGTVLSVAEVRFDPAPLPVHRDLDGCVADLTTVEKEPTPDIVHRLCADALDGEVIGAGGGGGPTWELVATDEPSGHWVTLRARDQIGSYRIATDGDVDALYTQLGPCCSFADHVAIAGTLRPGTTGMRAILADGTVIAGEGFVDPTTDAVHSIVLVPVGLIERDSTARVEVRLADGSFEDIGTELNLAILGG